MLMTYLLVFLGVTASLFPLLVQPFSLGVFLLVVACVMSFVIGGLFSSWVGMFMFLIYVGGLLVMFVFVLSFLTNLSFSFIWFVLSFLVSGLVSAFFLSNSIGLKSVSLGSFSKEMGLSLFLLEPISSSMFIGLVALLFVIMVAVVKLCCYPGVSVRGYYA
uniref:NADH dehydrogenase subunit 6 n=1 Tax=Psilodens balduri TaxID=1494734 RepID=A0A2U8LL50_9MOLL|nr:NADH dehydrogenase subunit 6 [Psilodens balduri]